MVNFQLITFQLEGTQKSQLADPENFLNIDYEMRLGTKIDCLFFKSSRLLKATEVQLLHNQCEQERTQILTNAMLDLENPRFVGYMLTDNRSMFLETDGSVAWFRHCPNVHSPLHTKNPCYDKLPIFHRGQIQFFDPTIRQTYHHAAAQNCSDRIKNLSQLDIDQDSSSYTLTPGFVRQDKPAIFRPQDVKPVVSHSFAGSQNADMHTRNELEGFWDSILINAASRAALEKFSEKLNVYTTDRKATDGSHYYTP